MSDISEVARKFHSLVEALQREEPTTVVQDQYSESIAPKETSPPMLSRCQKCVEKLSEDQRTQFLHIIDRMSDA